MLEGVVDERRVPPSVGGDAEEKPDEPLGDVPLVAQEVEDVVPERGLAPGAERSAAGLHVGHERGDVAVRMFWKV